MNGISVETGHNVRTVGRALKGVSPDGQVGGRPAWHMRTALQALRRRERDQVGPDAAGDNTLLDEIERVGKVLEDGLETIRAEPDVEKRMVMLRDVGPFVGTLDKLMEEDIRARQGAKKHDVLIANMLRDRAIGGAIAEVLYLGNWNLNTEKEARPS
jgi:hypothetical protein